jgi:hypothetical protein
MPFPFEVSFDEVLGDLDRYVDEVCGSLQSGFISMPKGPGFIEYPVFENGYEALKRSTQGFRHLSVETALAAVRDKAIALIVLRAMLGFTPSELAEASATATGVDVTQGAARSIDRSIRLNPERPLSLQGVTGQRVRAMIATAVDLLNKGPNEAEETILHRLEKADTAAGILSIAPLAELGVPYAVLLYERFLGRPFAGHRDSVSGLVGDTVETAIEEVLHRHGVSFRKTKRAERVQGFEQAPDFIIPDEFNPQIIIEAKLAEDDGTARDKVTRVQHLHTLSMRDRTMEQGPRYEVIACIAGRGFKQRREDMKKLLTATRGKVFTLQTIPQIVENTRLKAFETKTPKPI